MGFKGGFRSTYDVQPVRRVMSDENTMQAIRDDVAAELQVAVDTVAERLAARHGLTGAAAQLVVAQAAHESADFLRWVRAGQARAAGVPARGLLDAMGYASPSSITRMVGTVDAVAAAQATVNTTGEAAQIVSPHGHLVEIHPAPGADLTEAGRRGWLQDDAEAA